MLFITSQWKFVLPQRCQISSSIWHILLLFNLFLNQAYLNCFWKRHGSFSFLWIKGMQCFTLFYLFFMAQAVPEDLSWTCTEVDLIAASSHNCLFASVIFGEFWFNWEYIRLLQSDYFFCHCAVSAKDKSGSKSKLFSFFLSPLFKKEVGRKIAAHFLLEKRRFRRFPNKKWKVAKSQ